MQKAYDAILSDYVDAESAANNSDSEPYRYYCACCWEEVRLCAVSSSNQIAHFRHHNGNNNVKCENYLGNYKTVIKNGQFYSSKRNNIDFFFSCSMKIFSIGIKLKSDEISKYENSGTVIHVKTSDKSQPIISIPVNRSVFYPDVSEQIPISKFSWEYYVSFGDCRQHQFELFKKDNRGRLIPTFFKIQNENNDSAKLIQSKKLYTNTPYIMLFTHKHYNLIFLQDVLVEKVISFNTLGRDFTGVYVIFTEKTPRVEHQLMSWNYVLESSESLSVIWPPSSIHNETMQVPDTFAYLYSTFELQAHGNINVNPEDIVLFENRIYKVLLRGRTKIHKKNAEILLEKCNFNLHKNYNYITVAKEKHAKYTATDNGAFFFNRYGVFPIGKGMTVILTPESEVRHYKHGYLDSIITYDNYSENLSGESLLQDILKHYKRLEKFLWSDYEIKKLSHIALQYLESCEKIGFINSVAKRYIKEGLI